MNLDQFLAQAGSDGPCVGIHAETSSPVVPPRGVELRNINGAHTRTLDALFDAFAEAWHFPPWFGRNKDAFNDFMRDLDNMVNTATGRPPAPGYLTEITYAHLILADQSEAFSWFSKKMTFYRDYYRDEASPPAAFGLLLSVTPHQLDEVHERWLTVGVPIANVRV